MHESDREMKTSERVLILCVLATVTLSAESAHKRLDSINDLKEVDFGGSVSKHSLLLLYWFANHIDINDNAITLSFDPNTGYGGSHPYGNYEGLLEQGYNYYTIGNLNERFPEYVRNPPDRQYEGGNRDRVIVRVEEYRGVRSIDRVYLTQHRPGTTEYDPDHTYQISTNLLQQIRQQQFHTNINGNQLAAFRRRWGNDLGNLGLFLFLVLGPDTTARLQGQISFSEQAYHSNYSHYRGNNDICDNLPCVCMVLIVLVILALVIISSPK